MNKRQITLNVNGRDHEVWIVPSDTLLDVLHDELGMADAIITQFGFDADAVLGWAGQVRQKGITLPIRIGVPGPAGVRRLGDVVRCE